MTAPPWTPHQIPDLHGRLAVVTGASSGIGLETARELARAGASVVLAVRSATRGDAAAAEIARTVPGAAVVREELDLSDLSSVARFVEGRRRDGRPLDLLVNNAGIMAIPDRTVTADGFEMQLGTNHLGHFALTAGLAELLGAARAGRVVTVSSAAAWWPARIHLDDLQLERRYRPWRAYGQSKLANLLFALELDRRSRAGGWGLASLAAHPGSSRTNLQAAGPHQGRATPPIWRDPLRLVMRVPGASQSAAAGAWPTLFAATSPGATSGGCYGPAKRFETVGPPAPARIAKRARDQQVAAALWAASEELTGARWPASTPSSTRP